MQRKIWKYSSQAKQPNAAFDVVDPGAQAVGNRPFHWEMHGFPIFLSLDFKWSCARLRMLVWQQLSRVLVDAGVVNVGQVGSVTGGSILATRLAEAILQADKSGSVNAQIELCKLLPLRLTNGFGEPMTSLFSSKFKCWLL
jgi:hypothetical protein